MSRTTVLGVWPYRRTEDYAELHNAWGFAPPVWSAISRRHLGEAWGPMSDFDSLWKSWNSRELPEHHRTVLMMTFDHSYIGSEDYETAADHIRRFVQDFPVEFGSGKANHWPEIARLLEEADYPAIGFWATSVSRRPFQGRWNEEEEQYDPFDWTLAFDVFAALEEGTQDEQ